MAARRGRPPKLTAELQQRILERVREGLRRPASPPGKGVEVVARLLPIWLTNKPLPHPHDYVKFAEEGARRNVIIASCIWTLVTSAAEPTFRAGRRKADGTVEPLPETDGTVQALQERRETARAFALAGWNAGLLTLNQALALVGYPPVTGAEGEQRKGSGSGADGEKPASPTAKGLGLLTAPGGTREGLAGRATADACTCGEAYALTPEQKRLRVALRRHLEQHFRDQGLALVKHLDAGWEA